MTGDDRTFDGDGGDAGSVDDRRIAALVEQVARNYADCVLPARVAEVVADSWTRLAATATVTTFLPTLAGRLARERLDALLQAEGRRAKRVPEVLFVCVHNAGRSQMAAAFARHYAGGHLHIRTGGSDPGQAIHPEVLQAVKEVGLSLDEEFPKPLTDEVLAAADVVVTMGCGDSCPFVPGRRYEDWPIPDPAGGSAAQVTAVRDDVDRRVRALLAELLPDLTLTPLNAADR